MQNRNKHLILAIDDRPEVLAMISEMLEGYYTVIGVKDYLDAIDVIEKQTPALFLLDIELPLFSGYDIAGLIRIEDRFKNTPILFLTGNATKDSVVKAVQNGGNDYIIKPVKKSVLLQKIRNHLVSK